MQPLPNLGEITRGQSQTTSGMLSPPFRHLEYHSRNENLRLYADASSG